MMAASLWDRRSPAQAEATRQPSPKARTTHLSARMALRPLSFPAVVPPRAMPPRHRSTKNKTNEHKTRPRGPPTARKGENPPAGSQRRTQTTFCAAAKRLGRLLHPTNSAYNAGIYHCAQLESAE